jgi:hypothetical protein
MITTKPSKLVSLWYRNNAGEWHGCDVITTNYTYPANHCNQSNQSPKQKGHLQQRRGSARSNTQVPLLTRVKNSGYLWRDRTFTETMCSVAVFKPAANPNLSKTHWRHTTEFRLTEGGGGVRKYTRPETQGVHKSTVALHLLIV